MSQLKRIAKSLVKDFCNGIKGNPLPGAFHADPFTAQRLLLAGREVRTILDVGGNKGQSVREYRDNFPHARIYSFEPFDDSFQLLEQTCRDDGNALPVRQAVSDAVGRRQFFVTSSRSMNSLLKLLREEEQLQAIDVETVTLDEFCRRQNVPHVDILKFDIQGGELLALRGASGLLSSHAVDVVYTEALFMPMYRDQANFFELNRELHDHGYRLFGLYGLRIDESHALSHGNAIFISPNIAEGLQKRAAS